MREAVIIEALRTPIGRAKKGSLKEVRPDDLSAQLIRKMMDKYGDFPYEIVEDLYWGTAFPEGEQGMNIARMLVFMAGLPIETGGVTVNRFCGSAMTALHFATLAIWNGIGDAYIVGGVESMSFIPMGGLTPRPNTKFWSKYPQAFVTMIETAINVAKLYNISRRDQDEFALSSHRKAVKAWDNGEFAREVVPVDIYDDNDNKVGVVEKDDGPRRDTSMEKLASLPPLFDPNGTVTAGNSSPLNDGASVILLMDKEKALSLGLKPRAKIVSIAAAGVPPEIMGIGPIPATHKALKRANMTLDDIDAIELNEAFASQSLAVIRELGMDMEKVNQRGGAIALGHPLGESGTRIITTLLHIMEDKNYSLGLATMCCGGGQGVSTIIERV